MHKGFSELSQLKSLALPQMHSTDKVKRLLFTTAALALDAFRLVKVLS
jgi:hypothetical protein